MPWDGSSCGVAGSSERLSDLFGLNGPKTYGAPRSCSVSCVGCEVYALLTTAACKIAETACMIAETACVIAESVL